jgi:hypothetical protein
MSLPDLSNTVDRVMIMTMKRISKKRTERLVSEAFPNYHIHKNPPKGLTRKKKDWDENEVSDKG